MIEEKIQIGNIGLNVKYVINHKPAVLFIHFSGGNSNMWEGVIPLFENDYSIIIPDIRGHGKSDKPMEGYHIDDMANDLYLLLRKLNIEQCHIIGSSMGAEIGLSLAVSHPELALSLTCEGALYNDFGEYGLFNGTEEEIVIEKEDIRKELAKRIERIFKTKEEYIEEERAKLTQEGIWTDYFIPFFENNLQKIDNGNFTYCYLNRVRTEYIEKYWDVKFEQYYKMVKCPVLFLPSKEEWENEKKKKIMYEFASMLDTFKIEHIENSIHAYVWMQCPVVVGKIVKNFINKLK